MELTEQQKQRIKEVLKQWHEAGRAEFERSYKNLDYDSEYYSKHYHVGEKYIRLDKGTSGCFMAEIETGIIYEIKGYGVPNKKKIAGEIWKPEFDGANLEKLQYVRGSYDARAKAVQS